MRNKVCDSFLRVVLVILPFISVIAVLLLNGYKFNFEMLIPAWNDEVGWFNQIETIINYGKPLGYYGYNGKFAEVGTFGAWGIAPLLPYALFGKIFGWELHSMALANMFFLSMALLLFVLLAKPTNKQVIWIILLYMCSTITVGYSMTSMSEGLRYSLAIVIVGILLWLERENANGSYFGTKQKIVIGCMAIFILFAIQVYLILALALPIFIFGIMRKKHIVTKSICAGVITIITVVISTKLVSMVSAPYTSSTIENIFIYISENGLYGGCCYVLNNFFSNLDTLRIAKLMEIANVSGGILVSYFIIYIVLLFILSYWVFTKKKESMDFKLWLALYFLAGFLVGYCVLYTGSSWTLCRGTNTAFLMALLLLACSYKDDIVQCKKIIVLMSIFLIGSSWWYLDAVVNERDVSYSIKDTIVEERKALSRVLELTEGEVGWVNTVAHYGTVNNMYLALPSGYGYNYMINGDCNIEARYALVTNDSNVEFAASVVDRLCEANYARIYEDSFFVVLEKVR